MCNHPVTRENVERSIRWGTTRHNENKIEEIVTLAAAINSTGALVELLVNYALKLVDKIEPLAGTIYAKYVTNTRISDIRCLLCDLSWYTTNHRTGGVEDYPLTNWRKFAKVNKASLSQVQLLIEELEQYSGTTSYWAA